MKIFRKKPEKVVPKEGLDFGTVFSEIADLKLSFKYDINKGGCGWFAYLMVKQFPHLKIYYKYPDDWAALKKGRGSACTHVLVYDGENYYDSDGEQDLSSLSKDNIVEVSLEYLYKSLHTKNVWNTMFSVDKVPTIEEKIVNVLKMNSIIA